MGKKTPMKKPAAAKKLVAKMTETTAESFDLQSFIRDLQSSLPAGPSATQRLIWGSGFDGMNAMAFCLNALKADHQQVWGSEMAPAPSMWALRHATPKHLYQDCTVAAMFELKGCPLEYDLSGGRSKLHDISRWHVHFARPALQDGRDPHHTVCCRIFLQEQFRAKQSTVVGESSGSEG